MLTFENTVTFLLGVFTVLSVYMLYDTLTFNSKYGISITDEGEDIWFLIFEIMSTVIYGYMFLKSLSLI